MAFRRVFVLVFAVALLGGLARANPGLIEGSPDLVGRWDLAPYAVTGRTVWPAAGLLPARVVGPLRFSPALPHALVLDGNAKTKHRVAVMDTLPPGRLPTRAITAEGWICVDKPQRWIGAIQETGRTERGWVLGTDGAGTAFCFGVAATKPGRITYLTDPQPLAPGQWYYLAGTYDGREQRLYVDGQLVRSARTQQGPIRYPARAALTIGAFHDDNETHPLQGRIERVSLYARALSADELRRLAE